MRSLARLAMLGYFAGAAVYEGRVGASWRKWGSEMAFKSPHVQFVSFAIEVTAAGTTDVMVIETDLHLNSGHPAYNDRAVQQLIAAAQAYLAANAGRTTHIRVISNRSGEI